MLSYNELSLTNHSVFFKRGYFIMSHIARGISFCWLHGGLAPRNPPTACTIQDNVILNVVLFLTWLYTFCICQATAESSNADGRVLGIGSEQNEVSCRIYLSS